MGWRTLFGLGKPADPASAALAVPATPASDQPAAPAQPATPAERTFAVDRNRMFDLALTSRLAELFATPAGQRDEGWTAAFFAAVWNASLEIAEPPFFTGPDGFPYARLQLPRPGAPFESNALANQAGLLVERGMGAAIFASPDATEPAYVLPMGVIDSLLRFDGWSGDPLDGRDAPPAGDPVFVQEGVEPGRLVATRDHQMLLGTPSAAFLPPHAARALYRHLTQGWGIAEPRIALLVDPSAATPRSLMLDRRHADFTDPASIEPRVRMLLWYLPPRSAIVLRPDHIDLGQLTPLATLFPAGSA